MRNLIIVTLLMLLVAGITACSETSPPDKEKIPEISIPAYQLYAEYQQNEIAADKEYEGKLLRVTGTVTDFGKDIADTAYIMLDAPMYGFGVQALFHESQEDDLVTLSVGSSVTVVGRCDGAILNVFLRDCYIAD